MFWLIMVLALVFVCGGYLGVMEVYDRHLRAQESKRLRARWGEPTSGAAGMPRTVKNPSA